MTVVVQIVVATLDFVQVGTDVVRVWDGANE